MFKFEAVVFSVMGIAQPPTKYIKVFLNKVLSNKEERDNIKEARICRSSRQSALSIDSLSSIEY